MLALTILALAHLPVGTADARAPAQEPKPIGCRLTLSIDQSMHDRWYHSPGEVGLQLAESTTVARGQPFAAYVFFHNWTENDRGEIGVDYDLRITRPNGGLYRSDEKLEAHSGVETPAGILLADQVVRPAFGPDDALGTYVVTITVRDRASGTKCTTKKSIELVEYAEGPAVEDKAGFDAWMRTYYKNPQPDRAIPVLLELGRAGTWKDDATSSAAAAFFHEVFANNAWLFPFLLKRFDTQDPDTKRTILRILARSSFDGQEFLGGLKGSDADAWKQVSAEERRDPLYDAVTKAAHLDELWAMFHASGKFAPVLRLCEALVPEQTLVIPGGPERAALKTAAAESLRKNARQLDLVRNYCNWIRSSETIPEEVRVGLEKALGSK